MAVQKSLQHNYSIPFGCIWSGSYSSSFQHLDESLYCFQQWQYQFIFPPILHHSSVFWWLSCEASQTFFSGFFRLLLMVSRTFRVCSSFFLKVCFRFYYTSIPLFWTQLILIKFSQSCCSATKSCLTLQLHELQLAELPCSAQSPWVCSNSCHPIISSSVPCFSSCPQSFRTSRSLPMSQFFASADQSIGASSLVLPINIEGWCSLGLTGLIILLSKGLSRVMSSTTVQKHRTDAYQSIPKVVTYHDNNHLLLLFLMALGTNSA